jgi:hypothetical protein
VRQSRATRPGWTRPIPAVPAIPAHSRRKREWDSGSSATHGIPPFLASAKLVARRSHSRSRHSHGNGIAREWDSCSHINEKSHSRRIPFPLPREWRNPLKTNPFPPFPFLPLKGGVSHGNGHTPHGAFSQIASREWRWLARGVTVACRRWLAVLVTVDVVPEAMAPSGAGRSGGQKPPSTNPRPQIKNSSCKNRANSGRDGSG